MRRGRRWALSRCSGASRWRTSFGCTAVTARMAVEEWVKLECGVYTQVVWRKSMELECAQATCVKAIAKPATTSTRSVILKLANQKTKSVIAVADENASIARLSHR
ncbi:hypothetical protein DEO72_LG8g2988 [Vigna unguiculata]|uniref:Uncharacterized protein n=1 Tax=Vigna unguiculata TaxID=3917 RepID=A0A4D6MTY2_VIGUN|nr:hypothetical protein DEO72_LG8g2988 [Vigna unguiculata]